jgi:5-methylcytosine-specific restriction endonuclease McrA
VETLVLSQGWEPVARVPWERAVVLLALGKVEVVEAYQERAVRSVTLQLAMPSVIRYVRHARRTGRRGNAPVVRFNRDNLWVRDGGRCQYCGVPLTRREATWEHVLPRARGGRACWENIVLACVPCNQRKGCRTPQEAGMRLLRAPVRPAALLAPLHVTVSSGEGGGVPASWRKFLRDVTYWHGALEEG